ncbi:MAG TPA: hypothetical protein DHW07_04150 [Gammaproteobacteria bacterium]|nr:hypothetical protein [Gammaproteobacteria bacterium]
MTGARATLLCSGQVQTQTAIAGGSYLSTSTPQLHFGLGSCTQVEHLKIHWLDGTQTEFRDLRVNQTISIKR